MPDPAIAPNCATPLKEVKAKLKKPIAIAIAVKNNAFDILLCVFIKKLSDFSSKSSTDLRQ